MLGNEVVESRGDARTRLTGPYCRGGSGQSARGPPASRGACGPGVAGRPPPAAVARTVRAARSSGATGTIAARHPRAVGIGGAGNPWPPRGTCRHIYCARHSGWPAEAAERAVDACRNTAGSRGRRRTPIHRVGYAAPTEGDRGRDRQALAAAPYKTLGDDGCARCATGATMEPALSPNNCARDRFPEG